MKLNIESQTSTENFSGLFQEQVDGQDISELLIIADSLAGGLPGLAVSVPEDGQTQLFKFVPVCECVTCLAIAAQDNVPPSETIMKAFLGYVGSRLALREERGNGKVH